MLAYTSPMSRARSDVDPRIGLVLDDRYRILERIGDGAMGSVYRGERVKLGRIVAIKFLRNSYADDPAWVSRFEREARAMSRLAHPHCVSVIDFGVAETPYIVMEMVTGQTLRALLDDGPVPVARAMAIVRQLLGALQHAHDQGIIHRDVKPGNVMLTEATGTGDHVRVLDFGLAKLAGEAAGGGRDGEANSSTASRLVIGTPSYMAPEQSRGRAVDHRCDIYSTGIVLFELLTGSKPFEADGAFEVLRMHQDESVPALRGVSADRSVVSALDEVISRATAKDPDDRFASAIEFSEALAELAGNEAAVAGGIVGSVVTARPARTGGFLGWLLVIAAIGAAAGWYFREELGFVAAPERPRPATTSPPSPSSTPLPLPLPFPLPMPSPSPTASTSTETSTATSPSPSAETPAATATPTSAETATTPTPGPVRDGGPPPADAAAAAASGAPASEAPASEAASPPSEIDEQPAQPDPEVVEIDTEMAAASAGEPAVVEEPAETPPVIEPPPVEPSVERPVKTARDAERLIKAGKSDQALAGLLRLRRQQPKSGYVHYLIGNIYFQRKWWTNGIDSYRTALRLKPGYRRYRNINMNAIRALASERTRRNATFLILRSIGKAAVPFLRKAARADKNPKVRKRAAFLAKKLASRRR